LFLLIATQISIRSTPKSDAPGNQEIHTHVGATNRDFSSIGWGFRTSAGPHNGGAASIALVVGSGASDGRFDVSLGMMLGD
jgi:hypothetical protein